MYIKLNIKNPIVKAFTLLFSVAAFGTFGYMLIEKWNFIDSLYMTVITLATIGYGEVHTLSGSGRIFTIFLIFSSIGIGGYAISTLASFVLEGEFNRIIRGRKMDKHIANLNNHIILCGLGKTGKCVEEEFHKTGSSYVVIEKNEEALKELLDRREIPYVKGDATDDKTLILAGIDKAKGLVTALGEDKDNVFVVLSARGLKKSLRIISRLVNENNSEKLKKAGADELISPNSIGGMRMASVMLRPFVVNFLDKMLREPTETVRLEEYTVTEENSFFGKTLEEAAIGRKTGLLVVAIKPSKGGYVFNPKASTKLENNDVLIVMGPSKNIALLK